jgi:GMP synthase-like glutamine amidotransferase
VKKILLVDNTFDPPHGCPEIQFELKAAAQSFGGLEIVVARAPEEALPAELSDFDGIVLSGSKTRIDEDSSWIRKEMDLIRSASEMEIPILGICYGEQLIAKTLAGRDFVGAAKTGEHGWGSIRLLREGRLLKGLPESFFSFQFHSDEVRPALGSPFVCLAESVSCPVQAYEHEYLPIIAVQFHPERGWEEGERSLARKKAKEPSADLLGVGEGSKLYKREVAEAVFGSFLRLVWAQA